MSACGGGRPAAPALGYGPGQPAVTIKFWYMPNGPDPERSMKAEAERFHQLHPNITVAPTMLEWGRAMTQLSTAASGGDGPDVTQLGTTWVGGISASGALRRYTAAEIEALGGRGAFLPASWTATGLVGTGQVTAVPWFADIRALFYRTDVLARLGLDPAAAFATWDSLEQTLARIKADGQVAALGQAGKNDWNVVHNVAPFIWGAGGDLLSADGREPLLSRPESFAGIDYYQRLMSRYNKPDLLAKNSAEATTAFAAGTTAVTMQGPDTARSFRAAADRPGLQAGWATIPLPAGPRGRYTFFGGSNLAIWKTSPHAGAAFEWVRFLTGASGLESQARYVAGQAGEWPAVLSAVAGTDLATDPVYKAFGDSVAFGRQYPAIPAWVDVETALQKDLSTLWDSVLSNSAPMSPDDLRRLLAGADADVRVAIQSK